MLKKELKKIRQDDEFTDIKKEKETNDKPKKKKKSKFFLPWWCKIVAYTLSLIFTGVSVFFIIVKGISFGDEKALKWLSSFVVSVFTSFLVTQPLQVRL